MMVGKYILSIDQGTTSSRAVLFDAFGGVAGMGQREFPQIYPQPGYVEHDAVQILQTTLYAMRQAVEQAGIRARDIAAISITNQRETTVAWDAVTGIPVCNAIVWQCRRTAPECERLRAAGMEGYIKDTTGLLIDPYFSGTKMKWILENVPAARDLAKKGRLRFGTIDTWLVYSLTDGAAYVTDVTNASRTMLFDIHKLRWDDTLLQELGIPRSALPRVCESGEIVGMCSADVLGEEIPIAGIAGDQHAALFGQCCFAEGMAKNTYGTGCFVLMNTGSKPVASQAGLLTTIAWKLNGRTTYALEGSAFNAGSAIQWLRQLCACLHRPGRPLLGYVRPGRAAGRHPGHHPGPPVPGGVGEHRPGKRRFGGGHEAGKRCGHPRAARGRRGLPQPVPDAVPGGHFKHPGVPPPVPGDHRPGLCHDGGAHRGPVGQPGGAFLPVAGERRVPAGLSPGKAGEGLSPLARGRPAQHGLGPAVSAQGVSRIQREEG